MWKKDGCKRCLSEQDVALLRMLQDWNLDVAHNHRKKQFQRCFQKRKKKNRCQAESHPLFPIVSLGCCGSGEYNAKTNWICRSQSLCSVSYCAKPPPQIPPKSQRYPALSHTYCSVAYLLKPANIRSLLHGPFLPSCFMRVLKFTISLLLSPPAASLSVIVTASFLPLLALFLSFLLPHGD